MRGCRDHVRGLRVPQQNVRIGSGSNGAFLRIHAEDPRRRRGGNLDISLQRDLSGTHSKVIEQLHPVLNSGSPVGNLAEVVFAQLFLVGKAGRTMVGRNLL